MAERCHAQLALAEGDSHTALALFERAIQAHATLPMPFEQAQTRLLHGRVLGRAGHRRDARRELVLAQGVFRRLGVSAQERQATDELAPVERQITRLVVEGRTNKEVAAARFLTVRTVETHLSRIYRKLGLRSRSELAAHARGSIDRVRSCAVARPRRGARVGSLGGHDYRSTP